MVWGLTVVNPYTTVLPLHLYPFLWIGEVENADPRSLQSRVRKSYTNDLGVTQLSENRL